MPGRRFFVLARPQDQANFLSRGEQLRCDHSIGAPISQACQELAKAPLITESMFRAMSITISALDHVVLNVADVETSANWYEQVLGMKRKVFEPAPGKPRRTSMLFGKYKLNLRPVAAGARAATFMTDTLCFLTETTPEDVVRHLKHCGIFIAEGPVAKHGAVGILISVYCRDPDGRLIEISAYED